MKIALVTYSLMIAGGSQRQLLSLARSLSGMGHDVAVYTFGLSQKECYPELLEGLSIVSLSDTMPSVPDAGMGMIGLLKRKLKKKKIFEKHAQELAKKLDKETQVINAHDGESYKVGYYFKKNSNTDACLVWQMNDPPVSYMSKGSLFKDVLRVIFNFFELLYERTYVRAVDVITVLDERNKEMAKKFYNRPTKIVRSGCEFDKFYISLDKKNSPHSPIRLFVSSLLAPHRRFEDAILAAKELKKRKVDFEMNLYSHAKEPGNYLDKLRSMISKNNLDGIVEFHFSASGVSEEEVVRRYRENDIFIFPNHIQTWGLSVFEAMAAGCVPIVSKTSGASEVLKDRENALLVDPLSPHKIAEKVEFLINHPDKYFEIAKKGQEFVYEHISWNKFAERMETVFEKG